MRILTCKKGLILFLFPHRAYVLDVYIFLNLGERDGEWVAKDVAIEMNLPLYRILNEKFDL